MFRFLRFSILTILISALISSCDGDKSESTNQLIISIPADYILDREDVWFFISTDRGELLGVQQGVNNSELIFETPENVKRFVLHQFNYLVFSDYLYSRFDIQSYSDVSPGNYRLKPRQGSQVKTGNHTLVVNNVPSNYNSGNASGSASFMSSLSGIGTTFTLQSDLYAANTSLFCYFNNLSDINIVPKYKFIDNVSVNETTTVGFSEFLEMDQVTNTFGFQADRVNTSVYAFVDDAHSNAFTLWSDVMDNVSSLKLYYPGNLFNEYFTHIRLHKGNNLYEYNKIGTIPSTFKTLNANVSSLVYLDNKLSVTSTGSFDYLYAVSNDYWTVNDHSYDFIWYYYMDDGDDKEFIIPSIPAQILNKYPELSQEGERIDFDFAYMDDYDCFAGYSEYLQYLLQSDEKIFQLYTENISLLIKF